MGISLYPTSVTLPKADPPYPTILSFLCRRFPRVEPGSWERRIAEGKVLGADGLPVTLDTPYLPLGKLFYFREVSDEPVIPFRERILFQDDQIIVCCKPHFLPVTPGGRFVEQCLVSRLRKSTGNPDIAPLHRIDRETAGIVLLSADRNNRGLYNALFKSGRVRKTYHALSAGVGELTRGAWQMEDRIVPGEPWFRMRSQAGEVNARSRIELVDARDGVGRFVLTPWTGKTHQLRLHMAGLGFGILNDRLYPALKCQQADDYDRPLQLVAKRLEFQDPVTGKSMEFESERDVLW